MSFANCINQTSYLVLDGNIPHGAQWVIYLSVSMKSSNSLLLSSAPIPSILPSLLMSYWLVWINTRSFHKSHPLTDLQTTEQK